MIMPSRSPLEEVRRFFHINPVPAGSLVVVAVSGGPDSVCLLQVLYRLREELGLRLHVAHLDHCLRGAESEADADYVRKLAEDLGLPVTVGQRDVNEYRREHRLSLEEAAREVRYAFLEEVVRDTGAYAVAIGHTADDRIETVLLNLLRGTGTRGLRGLMPVSHRDNGEGLLVLRPLLEVSREATQVYCLETGLEPRQDASNLSKKYTRNRVRHNLIPTLRAFNPRIEEAMLRLARLSADDADFIEKEVENVAGSIVSIEGEAAVIDRAAFTVMHPALQRGILRAAVLAVRGTLKDIEAGHIEDMLEAGRGPSGNVITLPDGLVFCIQYDRYILAADNGSFCPLPELWEEYPLTVPGVTMAGGWAVTAEVLPSSDVPVTEEHDPFAARMDYDLTGPELTVRARRRGDRFRPLGLGAEKKVGEFMIDEHVPRAWRDRVPLVVSPQGIVWVAGYRIDDRYKVTVQTGCVLRLQFRRTS